jgi:hypothetical protein
MLRKAIGNCWYWSRRFPKVSGDIVKAGSEQTPGVMTCLPVGTPSRLTKRDDGDVARLATGVGKNPVDQRLLIRAEREIGSGARLRRQAK